MDTTSNVEIDSNEEILAATRTESHSVLIVPNQFSKGNSNRKTSDEVPAVTAGNISNSTLITHDDSLKSATVSGTFQPIRSLNEQFSQSSQNEHMSSLDILRQRKFGARRPNIQDYSYEPNVSARTAQTRINHRSQPQDLSDSLFYGSTFESTNPYENKHLIES